MLHEFLQRKLVSPDRTERNQCTVLAVAAGIQARLSSSLALPVRSRVSQAALELRITEWQSADPLVNSEEDPHSFNERTLLSLRHDIVHPGHDSDYRSMSIFLLRCWRSNILLLGFSMSLTPEAETQHYR